MGKGLLQYLAENPPQEIPETERDTIEQAAASREQKRQIQYSGQDGDKIRRLKSAILAQLEQGGDTRYIAYLSLEAIGILTNDLDFETSGKKYLDEAYKEVLQQSLLTDKAAEEARNINQMRIKYNEKLHRQIKRQIEDCYKITAKLNDVLATLDGDKE